MIDPSVVFKIKQMRARGKNYNELSRAFHLSKSTISKVLLEKSGSLVSEKSGIGLQSSLLLNEQPLLIQEDDTPDFEDTSDQYGTESTIPINEPELKLLADSDGLRFVSIDSEINTKQRSLFTPLGEFIVLCGIVGFFIWIFKKIRGYDEGT